MLEKEHLENQKCLLATGTKTILNLVLLLHPTHSPHSPEHAVLISEASQAEKMDSTLETTDAPVLLF